MKRHPVTSIDLALYAGGDVNLIDRLRIALHLRRCAACDSEVESLRDLAAMLRQDASYVPESIDWDRLSAEMTANIHLGLDAGAIAGSMVDEDSRGAATALRPDAFGWRLGVVMASLTLIVVSGWWLGRNRPDAPSAAPASVMLIQAGGQGVEFQEHGSALALYSPGEASTNSSVDTSGTAQVQYVNSNTGQATIYRVYAE